jgi:RimJ/RimL family protein N-acetyltransferase
MLAEMGSRPDVEMHADFRRIRPPLEGRLVRLRSIEPEDAGRLNPMFNDPAVLAGLTMAMPQASSGFHEWHEAVRRRDDEIELIIETLEGEAIGACGVRGLNERNRAGNLGIWIARPYWGRGFGTDAVRTLCRFAFRHMNLQRVDLHVYANNLRGRRAYEKVGFRLEGTLRRAQFVSGEYVDELVMGLLAEELTEEA